MVGQPLPATSAYPPYAEQPKERRKRIHRAFAQGRDGGHDGRRWRRGADNNFERSNVATGSLRTRDATLVSDFAHSSTAARHAGIAGTDRRAADIEGMRLGRSPVVGEGAEICRHVEQITGGGSECATRCLADEVMPLRGDWAVAIRGCRGRVAARQDGIPEGYRPGASLKQTAGDLGAIVGYGRVRQYEHGPAGVRDRTTLGSGTVGRKRISADGRIAEGLQWHPRKP